MIPCYVDVFYPEVGIATLQLLEKLGVDVEYPFDRTCCGQPMANGGCESDARATEELFIHDAYQHAAFRESKYAVLMTGPSGSADIGGKTVHPAQGVMTLTVIIWPADRA